VFADDREEGIESQLLELIVAPQTIETIMLLCSSKSESLTDTDEYSTP